MSVQKQAITVQLGGYLGVGGIFYNTVQKTVPVQLPNSMVQFSALPLPYVGAPPPTVTWSISSATGGAVDQNGLYTPGGSAGTDVITLTVNTSPSTAYAVITIVNT